MAKCIYFAGSIRAGRKDAVLYSRIVTLLKGYGTVLTEHVGDPNLTEAGEFSLALHSEATPPSVTFFF